MSVPIYVPTTYGYVLLAATSSFFVNTYHMMLTGKSRKAAKITYPQCYGTPEQAAKDPAVFKFNCAQRAHANFTENHTSFLGALLIAGLRFPLVSAGVGALWVLQRVSYARGYTKNGPEGRRVGLGHMLADATLKLLAIYTSVSFILEL